jgi:hypothetical protein
MRHLRFLRFMGILAIWSPSDHQEIPCLAIWPWRRRRPSGHHLCSANGRGWLLPSSVIPVVLFPPPSQKILRRLRNAYCSCSVFRCCILGKVQFCLPNDFAGWWGFQRSWRSTLAGGVLVARWEVGWNGFTLRARPLDTLFLRPQCLCA